MPTLAFDTATEVLAVSLGDNARVICDENIEAGRSHLELLLPTIHDLLKRNDYSLADIDQIVVGTGPGTFSGLRVGVSTARALAQALEIPLSGFSTLEAVALELSGSFEAKKIHKILPLIDAKRGQVFTRLYRIEEAGSVIPESDVLCLDPETLQGKVVATAQEKVGVGETALFHIVKFSQPATSLNCCRPRMKATLCMPVGTCGGRATIWVRTQGI